MLKRLLPLALLAACADSGRTGQAASADSASLMLARAIPAAAFRIPAGGGALSVYALPELDTTPWGAGSRLGNARTAVGVDMIGRRLLFRDSSGAITSFDLVSLRQRAIGPRHASASIAADGALLAVDSTGAIIESQPWGVRDWPGSLGRGVRDVFAAPGPRLLAIKRTRAGDSLELAARETGVSLTQSVPQANDVAASRDGDAIAFATDSGVTVYEDASMDHPWFVRLSGSPSALLFSPSGHRIYVALQNKNALAVVDRFSQRERTSVSLPGPASALRADPWGRVILARPAARDAGESWVVGVAKNAVTGTLTGSWSSDLPAVAQSGVLLSREGSAVVARDLRSLDSLGAVEGGARDLWFAGRWVPSSAAAAARTAATEQSSRSYERSRPAQAERPQPTPAPVVTRPPVASAPSQTPAPANRTPAPVAQTPAFYAQLLATRNEETARSLVSTMAGENSHVKVEAPRPGLGDDNWRVLAGPFRSRDAADSAGRSMGRPYWVVDRSREGSARP